MTGTRVDLHIYSRYSNRSADWLLRRLEFPASASEPRDLYRMLRESGMDFITITDQDTIEGCLEIADEPGVFLSEETGAVFPEDGVRVQLLIWGITEEDHRTIQELKKDIYALQSWLVERNIAHAVAAPLHVRDEKFTAQHLMKLALLFRHFETLNGLHPSLSGEVAQAIFGGLTPEDIARYAEKTGMEPAIPEAWRKVFIGGSDDHGAVHPGHAWTATPKARTVDEFLTHVREGRCEAGGKSGSPILLAHNTYSVAFKFARSKLGKQKETPGLDLLEKVFSRFMEGRNPTEFSLQEKFGFIVQGVVSGKIFDLARVGNSSLWKELNGYFSQPEVKRAIERVTEGITEPEQRAFRMANLISGQLAYRFFTRFIAQLTEGRFMESIEMASPLVPLALFLTPYVAAFRQPTRHALRGWAQEMRGQVPEVLRNKKRAWFTDTLEDVNGVSTTIRRMAAAGVESGRDIVVVTCRSETKVQGIPLKNFQPIGEFELPEYELQRLSFPPILEILEYIERERFSELIISTPGPVGLVALLAAKMLGLPCAGIYHTDFPQYVRILTDDSLMETLTWNFMHWFYHQMDLVYVNSEDYRVLLANRGIAPEKLKILPRGLDTVMFHPSRRDEGFWRQRGLKEGEVGCLFVGRVSKEKNLDLLAEVAMALRKKKRPVRFLLVGDGPYREEMQKLLPEAVFTGYLEGEELAKAYASADVFVFPSTTDTFGNVVLEAQASGLPCIVSDVGGPRDLVTHGEDGLITKALDRAALERAIEELVNDAGKRTNYGRAARAKVEQRDWTRAFEQFWAFSPE